MARYDIPAMLGGVTQPETDSRRQIRERNRIRGFIQRALLTKDRNMYRQVAALAAQEGMVMPKYRSDFGDYLKQAGGGALGMATFGLLNMADDPLTQGERTARGVGNIAGMLGPGLAGGAVRAGTAGVRAMMGGAKFGQAAKGAAKAFPGQIMGFGGPSKGTTEAIIKGGGSKITKSAKSPLLKFFAKQGKNLTPAQQARFQAELKKMVANNRSSDSIARWAHAFVSKHGAGQSSKQILANWKKVGAKWTKWFDPKKAGKGWSTAAKGGASVTEQLSNLKQTMTKVFRGQSAASNYKSGHAMEWMNTFKKGNFRNFDDFWTKHGKSIWGDKVGARRAKEIARQAWGAPQSVGTLPLRLPPGVKIPGGRTPMQEVFPSGPAINMGGQRVPGRGLVPTGGQQPSPLRGQIPPNMQGIPMGRPPQLQQPWGGPGGRPVPQLPPGPQIQRWNQPGGIQGGGMGRGPTGGMTQGGGMRMDPRLIQQAQARQIRQRLNQLRNAGQFIRTPEQGYQLATQIQRLQTQLANLSRFAG